MINHLQRWKELKRIESNAAKERRELEDLIRDSLEFDANREGAQKADVEGYQVKATGRIARKVDSDKLQQIAAENGLSSHLSSLFRWSPTVNAAVWKAADESITNVLSEAITAKPGRLSFSIEQTEE